jgi:DNA-binding winged helix-turn-helix (wHTH) protein
MSSGIVTNDTVADAAEEVIRFGPFTLRPSQRVLTEGDDRIHLGSRAFDILLLLLERAGTFVAKNEIVARVWPTTVVGRGQPARARHALRKALGDGRTGADTS